MRKNKINRGKSKYVFPSASDWDAGNERGKMEAAKDGRNRDMGTRNGADGENKRLDTGEKTSCDRSCYETPPLPVKSQR